MPQHLELSITIPAYNEEKRIGRTLQDYLTYFQKIYRNNFELIVILNGCRDNTFSVVRAFHHYPQLRYKNIPAAIGKGGALIKGFKMARGAIIGFVDADDSTPAREFYRLLKHLNHVDAVIASRWISGAIMRPPQPLFRRVASRVFNILVRLLFGLPYHDTQCGGKIIKRQALDAILPHLGVTNWAFDIDLLYQFKRHQYTVLEVPTVWEDKSKSTLNIPKASFEMLLAIIRLRLVYSPVAFVVALYNSCIQFFKKLFHS